MAIRVSRFASSLLVLASLLSTTQTSLAQDSNLAARRLKQEVYVNLGDEPPSMDPTKYVDTVSNFWLGHMFEGLMIYNEKGALVPGTAASFTTSPDKKTYTFKIRKNAKWHDGKPVVAGDFEFAFKRLVDPAYASEYSFIAEAGQILNAAEIVAKTSPVDSLGVRALNDETFEVKLKSPVPYFISLMAFQTFFPVRKDIVEKAGDKFATSMESVVGNGPFKIVKWQKEHSMRMEKAATYWNAAQIKMNAIESPAILKDSNSAYNVLTTGNLDILNLDSDLIKRAAADKMKISTFLDGFVSFVTTNRREGRLFSNIKIRQALKYGLNRKEFVNRIVSIPGTKVAFGFIPENIPGSKAGSFYRAEHPVKWNDNDMAKAKSLIKEYLAETKQTKVPSFTILSGDTSRSKVDSEYMQSHLSKLFDTEVKIDSVPFKTRLQKSRDGQFDIALSGWGPDYADPLTYLSVYSSPTDNNKAGWDFEGYKKMLADANELPDAKARGALLFKAESKLLDEGIMVPYLQSSRAYITATGLTGVTRRVFSTDPDFRFASWKAGTDTSAKK